MCCFRPALPLFSLALRVFLGFLVFWPLVSAAQRAIWGGVGPCNSAITPRGSPCCPQTPGLSCVSSQPGWQQISSDQIPCYLLWLLTPLYTLIKLSLDYLIWVPHVFCQHGDTPCCLSFSSSKHNAYLRCYIQKEKKVVEIIAFLIFYSFLTFMLGFESVCFLLRLRLSCCSPNLTLNRGKTSKFQG